MRIKLTDIFPSYILDGCLEFKLFKVSPFNNNPSSHILTMVVGDDYTYNFDYDMDNGDSLNLQVELAPDLYASTIVYSKNLNGIVYDELGSDSNWSDIRIIDLILGEAVIPTSEREMYTYIESRQVKYKLKEFIDGTN